DSDAVVPTIRAVEESSVGMHPNLGRGVLPLKVLWQRRNRLQFLQHTTLGIVTECGHCGLELIDRIDEATLGVKGKVPRTRTGGRNLVEKCEFSGPGIDGKGADRAALLVLVGVDLAYRV